MKTTIALTVALLSAAPLLRASDSPAQESTSAAVKSAVIREVKRFGHDVRSIAAAPAHWSGGQWARFGAGTAVVTAVYLADDRLYSAAQRNRSSFTNGFAKVVTPFGARRAEDISMALIAGGLYFHDEQMRDAGRDSLEAEIIAGGIVTPLLKRGFGRSRPRQNEGARSFRAFASGRQSFPSGHATNAFAAATAIAAHYDGWLVPTVAYTLATGVAMSRVNDRAHFPSDVLAGALIGRAIAKSVVHMHRRTGTSWTITPSIVAGRPAVAIHIRR